jgi:dihydroxyacetone kinase
VSLVVGAFPADIHASAKAIAAMRGGTAGDVIAQAWREFVERHGDEFAAGFERAASVIRDGDTEGLAAHANRFATAETDAAMEAAGLKQ